MPRGGLGGRGGEEVTGESELLKEIINALESEGGEATLDRLLYAYACLREAGREKVLEVAMKSGIEVLEETLYKYQPNLHRYILLRLHRADIQDRVAKKPTVDAEPACRRV